MAGRLWVEVYTPDDQMLGIVNVISATVTRLLDAAGEFVLSVPSTDRWAVEYLREWRRVKLYWEHPRKGKQHVGGGVLLRQSLDIVAGTKQTSWTGMDDLHEMARANTLLGLVYDDQPIETVAIDLGANVTGWAVDAESGLGSTSRRFDDKSILQALIATTQGVGAHLRLDGDRRVAIGTFGEDTGLRITNIHATSHDLYQNDEVVLIDRLSLTRDGYNIVNWVVPVWGSGDGVLTLKRSTRTSPYPIQQTTGPNGRTVYYLTEPDSVAEYGAVQAMMIMSEAPYLAASATGLVNGANVLYDWAVAQLPRRAYPQRTYSAGVVKLDRPLLPGDKARLAYAGKVYQKGVPVQYAEINEMFWVLEVTETYDAGGQRINLEISNIDEPMPSAESRLTDVIIAQDSIRMEASMSATTSRYENSDTLDSGAPVTVEWTTGDLVVDLGRSLAKVTRQPDSGPYVVSVWVDDVEAIGAQMWDDTAPDEFTVEIDDALAGMIQGEHTVEVRCMFGSGTVDLVVEVTEIVVNR